MPIKYNTHPAVQVVVSCTGDMEEMLEETEREGAYVPKCYISTCHEKPTVTRKMTVSGRGGRPWEREIQVCAKHDELLDGMVQLDMPVIGDEPK